MAESEEKVVEQESGNEIPADSSSMHPHTALDATAADSPKADSPKAAESIEEAPASARKMTMSQGARTAATEYMKGDGQQEISNKIFTIPNLISFIRLLMIPGFFVLLLDGHDLVATLMFGIAASTDWIDGQVARRTNSVSKLGRVLDPTVDRLLMIMGVVGLYIVGRLPLWVIVVVLGRDAFMLLGGAYVLARYRVRVDVIYLGKVVTTLLFLGFFGLLANWPLVPGLGVTDLVWFPGWTAASASWGIWCVYAGLLLGAGTTTYYIVTAVQRSLEEKRKEQRS